MANFGIKSVSYVPICSSEEIQIEIKKPTGNEIVRKMWDKLDDEEQGFINVMIDRDNRQNEEIERLNKEREIDIKYNKYLQKEIVKANSIIKELREEMKNAKHISVEDEYHIIKHEKKLNEILDKAGSDKE